MTFAVTAGGGTVVPSTAVATLADGTATVTSWRLGTTAGATNNALSATTSGGAFTGSSAGGVTAADEYSIVLRIVDSGLTPPPNCVDLRSSMLMSSGSVGITRAWIQNGAPLN